MPESNTRVDEVHLDPEASGIIDTIEGHEATISSRHGHGIVILVRNRAHSRLQLPNEELVERLHPKLATINPPTLHISCAL